VYDVIIVGAGSVGLPTAFFAAEAGLKPLAIDQFASPGQGSNKAAIGGIRATHSAPSQIRLCLKSIEIFSTWQEIYGDNVPHRLLHRAGATHRRHRPAGDFGVPTYDGPAHSEPDAQVGQRQDAAHLAGSVPDEP
jgi:glycine/D-amino acid oxidase-like deaminating enzyme